MPEMPGGVERDSGRGERAGQAGEAPGPAVGADRDDARAPARLQGEDRAGAKRAAGPGDPVIPREGEIRLRPGRGDIAGRPPGERPERTGPAPEEQPPGCG